MRGASAAKLLDFSAGAGQDRGEIDVSAGDRHCGRITRSLAKGLAFALAQPERAQAVLAAVERRLEQLEARIAEAEGLKRG